MAEDERNEVKIKIGIAGKPVSNNFGRRVLRDGRMKIRLVRIKENSFITYSLCCKFSEENAGKNLEASGEL